jgi:hypothetical protein
MVCVLCAVLGEADFIVHLSVSERLWWYEDARYNDKNFLKKSTVLGHSLEVICCRPGCTEQCSVHAVDLSYENYTNVVTGTLLVLRVSSFNYVLKDCRINVIISSEQKWSLLYFIPGWW